MTKKKSKAVKKIARIKTRRHAKRTGIVKIKREASRPSATIEFCHKCSSIMIPVKRGSHNYLKCRSCGAEKKKEVRLLKISESVKKRKGVTVLEKDVSPLPLTEKICPRCENNSAHWWLQQTRSADEPPTQFFRCAKCKYTWREYK